MYHSDQKDVGIDINKYRKTTGLLDHAAYIGPCPCLLQNY